MSNYEITITETQEIPVVKVQGFLNDLVGDEVCVSVGKILRDGKINVILDFSQCKVINSPGASCISELVWTINDDFHGKIVFCGLDKLKQNVFNLIGIIPPAIEVNTLSEALDLLK